MGAQINLEFSGIPDDVEVTIDAWAATAEDLAGDGDDGEDFMVDQATKLPALNTDDEVLAML